MNNRAIYTVLAIVVVLILAVWLLSPRPSTVGTQTSSGPGVTRTSPDLPGAATGPGSGTSTPTSPSSSPTTTTPDQK